MGGRGGKERAGQAPGPADRARGPALGSSVM